MWQTSQGVIALAHFGDGETRASLSESGTPRQLMKVSASSIDRWLKDEPQLGNTELLLKLEDAHPGKFIEGNRRTLQRRLQEWRVRVVRELVYGTCLLVTF